MKPATTSRKNVRAANRRIIGTCLALLMTTQSEAVEITPPLKVFTFTGIHTETAMRAKDYQRVISEDRVHGPTYGFHDLVNLCAAYIFEGRYRDAKRACARAERYSIPTRGSARYRGPDAWRAYSNHAVASAQSGDITSARRNIDRAVRLGGDAAVLEKNLAAIEIVASEAAAVAVK